MGDLSFKAPLNLPDRPPSLLPVNPMGIPDLTLWVDARAVTALLALKEGQVVHESYYQGTSGPDLRISWSVAKSFLSALMGIVVHEGDITSLDDPVTKYAPSLKGGAYDGATIRNVLNMASGVPFDKDYLGFWSVINKMGRVLAMGGSLDKFAAGLMARNAEPGALWQYDSIDSHVPGMVFRGAIGRCISGLMVEKLLAPLGLEADPYCLTDGNGVAFVMGGLNMRTREYARLGLLFVENRIWRQTTLQRRFRISRQKQWAFTPDPIELIAKYRLIRVNLPMQTP